MRYLSFFLFSGLHSPFLSFSVGFWFVSLPPCFVDPVCLYSSSSPLKCVASCSILWFSWCISYFHWRSIPDFFPLSFFLLSSFRSPSFLGLITIKGCQLLGMAGLLLQSYRWRHNPFDQRKDSHSLFPVDGVLIPVTFLKNQSHGLWKIYFFASDKLLVYYWDWTRVPAGNNSRSKRSPSELACPSSTGSNLII